MATLERLHYSYTAEHDTVVPCPTCVPSHPPAYVDVDAYGDDAVQALFTNT